MIPAAVEAFRNEYRAREIGRLYTGWGHFALTSLGSLAAIAFAVSRVAAPTWAELALVPATFLLANVAEYFGHKGPMHHRRPGLGLLYERHTLQHHRFYTREAMRAETSRDFKMVLFPPIMLGFFLGLIATPIGAALGLLVSPNAGFIFAAMGVGYFLLYEWCHFSYHLPETSPVARFPLVAWLARHHGKHHDPALMGKWNFNITFPLSDWIFGTYHRG